MWAYPDHELVVRNVVVAERGRPPLDASHKLRRFRLSGVDEGKVRARHAVHQGHAQAHQLVGSSDATSARDKQRTHPDSRRGTYVFVHGVGPQLRRVLVEAAGEEQGGYGQPRRRTPALGHTTATHPIAPKVILIPSQAWNLASRIDNP